MDADERYLVMVAIAAQEAGMPDDVAHQLFDCFWITLATALAAGNSVSFPGVGLLSVQDRGVTFEATRMLERVLGAIPDSQSKPH